MVLKKKYVLVREPVVEAPKVIKRKIKLVRDEDIIKAIPITLGDEVQQALEEWYKARGEKLPEEYIGFGSKVDDEERGRFNAIMEAVYPSDPSMAPKQIGPKPEFGTPEFWRWARERRAEKNAERAAKGLPPLPTKGKKAAEVKKDAEPKKVIKDKAVEVKKDAEPKKVIKDKKAAESKVDEPKKVIKDKKAAESKVDEPKKVIKVKKVKKIPLENNV